MRQQRATQYRQMFKNETINNLIGENTEQIIVENQELQQINGKNTPDSNYFKDVFI